MVLSYVFLIDIYLIDEGALTNDFLTMNKYHRFRGIISLAKYNALFPLWMLNYVTIKIFWSQLLMSYLSFDVKVTWRPMM